MLTNYQKQIISFHFDHAFQSKKGQEFQDFFVDLASHYFGGEFMAVRSWGMIGDFKCDGYHSGTETVFQCYAPYDLKQSTLIKKINSDFKGAVAHWNNDIKRWVFVHNEVRGLSPMVVSALQNLKKQHPNVKIEVWTRQILHNMVMNLSIDSLIHLFPSAIIQLDNGPKVDL